SSQAGDDTTIRRAWGRWEGSHVVGGKATYTLTYNNYRTICENCIGTWSGERMKESYTLLDYYGKPWTGRRAGTYTNYAVEQPVGIFTLDRLDQDKNANSKLLGSIAYVRANDRFAGDAAVFVVNLESVEVANTAVYIEPGSHTTKHPFALHNAKPRSGANLIAKNLTAVGGKRSIFGSGWNKSHIAEGSSLDSVGNVFTSSRGANLCYRYRDGALTNEPLWPWPMNTRIMEAMASSGRTPLDVTRTIESLFGSIPPSCKGTTPPLCPAPPASTDISEPSAPTNAPGVP
ncbi:MAG: hypothetical protein ACREQW_20125, partial [Candidatus Binatia bacterium]